MELEITQEILDEVNNFLKTRAVQVLNDDAELSFSALVFVLQSLVNAVDNAEAQLNDN